MKFIDGLANLAALHARSASGRVSAVYFESEKQLSTLDRDKDVRVMDTLDIALRLSAASIVGVVLGLNRDLHGKATGVRTLGVLCLGSALAVLSIHEVTGADASRVIQGVVTGVGFLGAGVIVRSEKHHHVQGLTTAACVWVTACMGAACAIAQWQIVVIGLVLILVILVFGGRFERVIDRRWPARRTEVTDRPLDTPK